MSAQVFPEVSSVSESGGEDRISQLFSQALDQQVSEDRKMQNLVTEVRSAISRIEDATGETLRSAVRTSVQATAGPAVDGAVARTMGPGLAEIRTAIDALNGRLDEIVVRLDAQADAISGLPTGVEMDAVGLGLASLRTTALTRDEVAEVVQDTTGATDMSLVLADMNQQLGAIRAELVALSKPAQGGPDVSTVVADAVAASESRLRASIDLLRSAASTAPASAPVVVPPAPTPAVSAPAAPAAPVETPVQVVKKRFDPLSDPLPTTLRFQADPAPIPVHVPVPAVPATPAAPPAPEATEAVEATGVIDAIAAPKPFEDSKDELKDAADADETVEGESDERKRRWFRREDS